MRSLVFALMLFLATPALWGQTHALYSPASAQALVSRAIANEMRTANDPNHPMRYHLRKSSPRLTTTKEIFETKDGAVARLIAVGDQPLSPADEQKEQARLDSLLADPSLQRHRQQGQENDLGMVMKILRMMPNAYLFEDAGTSAGPSGPVVKFNFRPNPAFDPPDLMSQALTAMSGQIWIDPAQEQLVHLDGRLLQDTSYGWGILGKLDQGGWLTLEQADVGNHQWRIVRFAMKMNLRIVWKNRVLDTTEEMTHYTPVAAGTDYRKAIRELRGIGIRD